MMVKTNDMLFNQRNSGGIGGNDIRSTIVEEGYNHFYSTLWKIITGAILPFDMKYSMRLIKPCSRRLNRCRQKTSLMLGVRTYGSHA